MHAGLPLPNLGDLPKKPVMFNLAADNNELNKPSGIENGAVLPNIVYRPSLVTWTT